MKDDAVPDEIRDILKTVAKKEHIEDYDVKLNEGNQKGEGFLGEVIFIELTNVETKEILSLVVKRAFTQDKIRELAPIRSSFLNEIYFYEEVYPAYKQLEREYNIKSLFKNIPLYFMSCSEETKEYLVLENLKHSGFEIFDKRKTLTRDHIEKIFKTYGHFHGLSFALKKKNPSKFQEISDKCLNIFEQFGTQDHFQKSIIQVIEKINEKFTPGKDDKYIKAFEKYLEKGAEIFNQCVNYRGKYDAILHGDCWSNNMMFKYDEHGKVSDMKIIDLQLIKPGSPAHDLSYCLYSGSTKEIFDELDDILRVYHNSLSSTLSEFGESVEELYPFEALKEDWQHCSKFSMIFSFLICRMKLTNQEDMIDLTDFSEVDISEVSDSKFWQGRIADSYDQRMKDIVVHMQEIGAL